MSRRLEPNRKKPLDMLNDLLAGHQEAAYGGPEPAAKYLERALVANQSMPNACKFFLYDLVAEATAALGQTDRCRQVVELAKAHLEAAQTDAPKHLQTYLPNIRFLERGIGQAVQDGRVEDALALCEQASTLGLGKHYEAKAASIRRSC